MSSESDKLAQNRPTIVQWIRVFFGQWLYELLRWSSWRSGESFSGTCFRCMHYKSQHIGDEHGVACYAEGGCDCKYTKVKR